MAKPHFDWKRFWTPIDESVNLDGGYLIDPDGKSGQFFNRSSLPLSKLSDQRCLALLGEPGMGKTTALEDSRAELQQHAVSAGEAFLWPDLRICGSDTSVSHELFDTQEFNSWREGKTTLNLFLDAFDECVLRVDVLVQLLLSRIRLGDPLKLRLRIACRIAEWPRQLHEGLAQLYGEGFHVHKLAPLRRIDVSKAAETYGLDVEHFMTAVDRREAVPFAAKPVTLNMLLAMFRQSGDLPSDLASLYKEGCQALCEENSETRTGRTTAPRLSAKQRVHIARRIAGIMVFCQRTSVIRHRGRVAADPADVTVDDISGTGQREKTEDGEAEMTPDAVTEVLDTGLFSGRGPDRLGWAHQTYSEFLASEYLQAHRFSTEQIANLVMHPHDRSRVVPQLHGVAAWLAGKSQEVFDRICATDPRVLLAADIVTFDDDRKGWLLDSFLGQIEERSAPFEWDERRHFGRLRHSALATRLRRYVEGGSWSIRTRVVAIEIAGECGAKDLQELLIKIALDGKESIDVRVYAVAAIGRIADEATKLELRPLAEGDPTDREDRLKGEALAALKGVLSPKEIFGFMSSPANSHHWNTYWAFAQDLARNLSAPDLPDALNWATRFAGQTRDYYFEGARNAILRSAQDHFDVPAVLTAFADFARARMKMSEPIWNKDVSLPESLDRKRVVQAIIDRECSADLGPPPTPSSTSGLDWSGQMVGESPLVRPEDLHWIVERFLAAEAGIRECWAELLQVLVLDVCIGTHSIDPVIEAAERAPEIRELLPNILGSIEIGSSTARQLKERAQARRPRPCTRRREGPSLAERMAGPISRCGHDVANAFPELVHHMAFGDEQSDAANAWSHHLHELPGWRDAEDSTRRTILEFGKAYLTSLDAEPPQRTGRKFTIPWTLRVAYLALRLLEDVEPEWLSQSKASLWQRWAAIIVDFETWNEQPTVLLDRALDKVPNETIARFTTLIEWEDRAYNSAAIARRLVPLWNPRIEESLLALARAPERAPSTVGELLGLLLAKESRDGIEYARSLLPAPLSNETRAQDLAREASVALLVRKPVLGWPWVWPILANHLALGRDITMRTAGALFPGGKRPWADGLAPGELADFYLWLCKEFPHSEDPDRKGGVIGAREQVADLRDSLLTSLSKRATAAAVGELTRISTQPGVPDVRHLIAQARHRVLEASWTSPTPAELLDMARNHQRRWVESGEQLCDVVLESLARYQGELSGELPAREDLWNEQSGKVWRPKHEDAISNHITRHLRRELTERGVVVNREVQIRPSPVGQRTDIHVDAIRKGADGEDGALLKVIIEVKGSWNDSLMTAMQEQLRDKYLKENDCHHGIYLVAWFDWVNWDPKDYRRRDAQAWGWDLDRARVEFDNQAKSLSDAESSLAAFVVDARLG